MKKILIVDDEIFNRILIEDILSGFTEEYKIISASTGKAALDLIIREKPVLVFLDMMLPDITGLDIIEQVRSNEELDKTKFIITTGCSPFDIKAGIANCADEVLYKPFHPGKILQVLNNLSGSSCN